MTKLVDPTHPAKSRRCYVKDLEMCQHCNEILCARQRDLKHQLDDMYRQKKEWQTKIDVEV